MFKNVAAKFMVFAFDSATNLPKTGDAANITAYVSKDYGTVTVLADTSATEMDATNAKGYYLFDAAQGETNADCLMVSAKSSTSGIVVVGAPAVIYTRPTTGWLAPTVAARTLDVSSTGEAGVDWANVGSPTTSLALTGTTIAVTQKVDVDTIKTNPVVNGGTITLPTNATLASTTGAVGSVVGAVGSVTGITASDVGAIKTVTDKFAFTVANQVDANALKIGGTTQTGGDVGAKTGFALTSAYDYAKGTVAMTESYAANGAAPTPVQATFAIHQALMQFAISSTNYTVKKLDNSTTAFVGTLDDGTNPTSLVRT